MEKYIIVPINNISMVTTMYSDPEMRLKQLGDYNLPDYFIFPPEILSKIDDWETESKHWHFLVDLIINKIRYAKISYSHSLIEGCIFYSIQALEYSLKAKYCLYLNFKSNSEDADKFLLDREISLGNFTNDNDNKLREVGLESIKEDITKLNNLRNGLFHFNYKKLMQGIKDLGWDYSSFEKEGSFIIYPNLVDDTLACNVFKKVIELLDIIFNVKKRT